MKPTWGHTYWLIWAIATFLTFIVPESYALFTNWRNTLSDTVWDMEKLVPGQSFWAWTGPHYLFIAIYSVMVFWLFFHLGLGMFR